MLFANFAEAMAEGRGKAQAETLRKARSETMANRVRRRRSRKIAELDNLRMEDMVLVSAGEIIPGDGEIIEGVASVDESAITGESAPVIREAAGIVPRSPAARGSFRSDQGADHFQSGRDISRSHDCAGRRRRAPEDSE